MSFATVVAAGELRAIVAAAQDAGKRVVLSHGSYDILHPGHIRHLKWAASQGDLLVVSVVADEVARGRSDRLNLSEVERAEHLAALVMVDYVVIDPYPESGRLLAELRPDLYVKGSEFASVRAGPLARERAIVEGYGGKVLFSSGDVGYSDFEIVRRPERAVLGDQVREFCRRRDITIESVTARLAAIPGARVLVVGELIIDEYVHSDPVGMSSDSPTIVVRPNQASVFVGGAGIVAQDVRALGAECSFVTVLGDDPLRDMAGQVLRGAGVDGHPVIDPTRPTIHKKRYLADGKKLLNVNVFRDQNIETAIEDQVCAAIEAAAAGADAIVIADFNYGVVTARVIDTIRDIGRRRSIPVLGDSQSSSQLGRVSRLSGITVATPSEREARLALLDQDSGIADLGVRMLRETGNAGLLVTLGARGLMIFDTRGRPLPLDDQTSLYELKASEDIIVEYLPSFADVVVDAMGAGDAMLSGLAVALASGGTLWQGAFIGNCASAIAVGNMGNLPVELGQVIHRAHRLLAPGELRRRHDDVD